MLASDVDLLRMEPRVFLDATDAATKLLDAADGALSGTTLTSAGSDFEAAGIDEGHVIVVNGEALEVDARTDATHLEVSRPRVDSTQPKIAPDPGTALAFDLFTFERLTAQEEAWVLGALGIDDSHPVIPLDETAIIDPAPLVRLIALRAIASAYERAAAAAPADDALAERAVLWRASARSAARATSIILDLDGDGVPDATRHIDTVVFARR